MPSPRKSGKLRVVFEQAKQADASRSPPEEKNFKGSRSTPAASRRPIFKIRSHL